jgi:hypothetical protein
MNSAERHIVCLLAEFEGERNGIEGLEPDLGRFCVWDKTGTSAPEEPAYVNLLTGNKTKSY